ncbi:MAG: Fic family protein [Candidatus Sericytochromatia bacterium]|nr:Fic family protein [Candidatus Sericytochromatia bacterium]
MTFDRDQPYNDLPALPPRVELETKAVLKKAIAANRALAELKRAGDLLPNQTVLLSTLLLQEAKQSSEIENIVTTNDDLYHAFADDNLAANQATKEVLHYNHALWFGFVSLKEGRPLSTRLFEDIASQVKGTGMAVRRLPGTKVGKSGGEVVYTPPEGEALIRDKLANLEAFIHADDDLDPLVKLAVMHYQFEAIHPFADGNGRTGRILNILYLIDQQLLLLPILYLSRYIIEHKVAYYEGLQRVTEAGDWEGWLLYILQAVEVTALITRDRILAIRGLMAQVTERVRTELPGIYSKDLVEILFEQPYCKIRVLETAGIAKRQTASRYLQELERIGILQAHRRGRETYYLNVPFYALLIQ